MVVWWLWWRHLVVAGVPLLQAGGPGHEHHAPALLAPVQLVAEPLLALLAPLAELVPVPGPPSGQGHQGHPMVSKQ